MERTFVMIKPDGVQRGLVGEIIRRLEQRGLKLAALKMVWIDRPFVERHYAAHVGKPFFEGLLRYITSGPVVAMVWEGTEAVAVARSTMGATNPAKAAPGTIRADLSLEMGRNLVHGSDAIETATFEIGLWFTPEELLSYARSVDAWIFE